MKRIAIFLSLALLWASPCSASKLRRPRSAFFANTIQGVKGKRRLDKTAVEGKKGLSMAEKIREEGTARKATEEVGSHKGSGEGVGKVSDPGEEEALFYDDERIKNEVDSRKEPSGLGRMEGHPLMEHNSDRVDLDDISDRADSKSNSVDNEIATEPIKTSKNKDQDIVLVGVAPSTSPYSLEATDLPAETPVPTEEATVNFPDTELVHIPAETDSPHALDVFGGNLVEPPRTFTDTTTQEEMEESTASEGFSPVETEEYSSSNHRQQPAKDENAKRTAGIVLAIAGVCCTLLALSYLLDLKKKNPEVAQKQELSFGGSQYETDTDNSSAPAGNSAYGSAYDMESVTDHNIENDACEVSSDPWSFDGNLEDVEFGNEHEHGAQTKGRIDTTIDIYRRRLANYVPRRNNAIYEEFEEDSSQTSDPIFEDGDEEEYMRRYGKGDATNDASLAAAAMEDLDSDDEEEPDTFEDTEASTDPANLRRFRV